jgi:prepilin-type N-terminal cleavage/methylation domain-containing protein
MMRSRKGFSLIEIMVALTMLSLVMMSVARMALYVSLRGRGNDGYAKRTAALNLESNKFSAMRFANIGSFSTTNKTFTLDGFTYTRKLTITTVSSTQYTIKIVVVPSATTVGQDSVTITRTAPPSSTALCTTC